MLRFAGEEGYAGIVEKAKLNLQQVKKRLAEQVDANQQSGDTDELPQ